MYNILKDEYGFSTRGINSWWGDIVSKTKTAARQGIQAISDFTNPLAGGETGGLGSYVPPTFQPDTEPIGMGNISAMDPDLEMKLQEIADFQEGGDDDFPGDAGGEVDEDVEIRINELEPETTIQAPIGMTDDFDTEVQPVV